MLSRTWVNVRTHTRTYVFSNEHSTHKHAHTHTRTSTSYVRGLEHENALQNTNESSIATHSYTQFVPLF